MGTHSVFSTIWYRNANNSGEAVPQGGYYDDGVDWKVHKENITANLKRRIFFRWIANRTLTALTAHIALTTTGPIVIHRFGRR